jgi:hypothetical protein
MALSTSEQWGVVGRVLDTVRLFTVFGIVLIVSSGVFAILELARWVVV